MIIAIDTSTDRASIAFYEHGLVAEHNWISHGRQTQEVLPVLDFLLKESGRSWESVSGIAVATGPGSFNGLRVGMSTAKTLALARNLPIAGIPTLDVVASQHLYFPHPVCAAIKAGRGRVATAIYSTASGEIERLTEYRNNTITELLSGLSVPILLAGEVTAEIAEEARAVLGEGLAVVSAAAAWHRAGFLAELAENRLARGDADDLASLQPIYLSMPAMGKG
jgi:tRNA threonylcarbamoyladenosine biosynthesis protein TsaB